MVGFEFDAQGWLIRGGRRAPSPHADDRPNNALVDLAVIHNISLPSGCFAGSAVEDLFLGRLDCTADPTFADLKGLRVSAHFFVRRSGEVLQFVGLYGRAWHAGMSEFQGRAACNDFSLGIELEGTDDLPYAAIQLSRTADLLAATRDCISSLRWIVGHSDIAPGRKTDPGPSFPWPIMLENLKERGCLLTRPST